MSGIGNSGDAWNHDLIRGQELRFLTVLCCVAPSCAGALAQQTDQAARFELERKWNWGAVMAGACVRAEQT
jgi:hypothetical protein